MTRLAATQAGVTWMLDTWMAKFKSVIESMTEEHPSMTWTADGEGELGEQALIVEQRFASVPEPMIWIGLPESVHQDLGGRVLATAGVETSDPEGNRATSLEIVEQAIGGLVFALSKRLARDISKEPSGQISFFPNGLPIAQVSIVFGENALAPLWVAFNPLLTEWLDAKPADAVHAAVAAKSAPDEWDSTEPEAVPTARTFDLLLDVSLPVSVSFGKTELAVKDVLKLTTGSIVELNRSVSEPVDVIVNNCIIARGEVVVVEGNYGVRINKIVSRQERMRTGGAAAAASRARVSAD